MARSRHKKPRTRQAARAAGYKSGLEQQLHTGPMKAAEYEPKWSAVEYTTTKTYNPDFAYTPESKIVYEAKGRFRTYEEAKKYINVKASNPDLKIRFIITEPNSKAYPQTKMKMGDWLTKHGFEWCRDTNVPEEWRHK